jgi:hypothetical protein
MADEFPEPCVELTHILVVSDLQRAREFWTQVVGATVFREYGGSSLIGTTVATLESAPPPRRTAELVRQTRPGGYEVFRSFGA